MGRRGDADDQYDTILPVGRVVCVDLAVAEPANIPGTGSGISGRRWLPLQGEASRAYLYLRIPPDCSGSIISMSM